MRETKRGLGNMTVTLSWYQCVKWYGCVNGKLDLQRPVLVKS